MKLLVTGANGQVGWEVVRQGAADYQIVALTRQELDITSAESVTRVIDEHQPAVVINAAAYTAVDKAEDDVDAAYAVNRDGVSRLARACQRAGIPLFHISTDYVFDGAKPTPYSEDDETNPQGVYGKSKLAGEEAVCRFHAEHIILRTSWVFGEHGNNFVKTILRLAKERDHLSVVADQYGAPTSAASIAACLLQLCGRFEEEGELPWGTYHFTGMPETTWHGFAEAIIGKGREMGLIDHQVEVGPITTAEYPTRAQRPVNSCLGMTKIWAKFNVMPGDWGEDLATMLIERKNVKVGLLSALKGGDS